MQLAFESDFIVHDFSFRRGDKDVTQLIIFDQIQALEFVLRLILASDIVKSKVETFYFPDLFLFIRSIICGPLLDKLRSFLELETFGHLANHNL